MCSVLTHHYCAICNNIEQSDECIWNNEELIAKADKHLVNNHEYYNFCDQCMGTENEITAEGLERRESGHES